MWKEGEGREGGRLRLGLVGSSYAEVQNGKLAIPRGTGLCELLDLYTLI
jgi:hypothetical protein